MYLDKVIQTFSFHLFINENRSSDSLSTFDDISTNIIFISEYIENDNKYQLDSDFFIICIEKALIFIQQTEIKQFLHFFTKNQDATIYFQSNEVRSKIERLLNLQIKNWKSKIFSKEELKSFTHEFSLQFNKTKLAEKTKIINFFSIISESISSYLLTKAYNKLNEYDRVVHCDEYFEEIKEKNININEYIILREIGNTNSVSLIYHIELEQLLALKIFLDENTEKLFERERLNYQRIRYPFFPKYFGTAEYYSYKTIVIEYIQGKSIDKLEEMNLSSENKIKIIFQIIIAIGYLHQNGFIYRDLKPDNIFIVNEKDSICIIDFDRMIDENKKYEFTKDFQLNEFVAPELFTEDIFSNKADIYSIGQIIKYIFSEEIKSNREYESLKGIVTKCTRQNDKERPNISELIEYFYINFLSKTSEVNESDLIVNCKVIHNMIYFDFLFYISENKHPESQYNLGLIHQKSAFKYNQFINKMIQYFSLAANQNHIKAQFNLGLVYSEGKFISRDINKAIYYLALAANQNHMLSQYKLGLIYYEGEFIKRDINKAIYYFTLAANHNTIGAQYNLGLIYYDGKFIPCDINKAIYYFTLAANQNYIDAQFILGLIYYDGKFIKTDIDKSIYYFTLAANQNDKRAQYNLGMFYYEGKLIKRDINKAIYYFTLSANQNDIKSQNILGFIYFKGSFITQDINKAIYYYTLAANQNDKESQYNLGIIYYDGNLITRDINKSIYYLTLAADQNDKEAQYKLGLIYYEGEFIKRDINKSMYYFTLSANQNDTEAQYNHGVFYYDGRFIKSDINKSMYYFTLAANKGHRNALFYLGIIYYDGKFIKRDINKAIYYYTLAANQNEYKSQNNLGLIYYEGKFIKRDINKAIYFCTLAANQNDVNSQTNLGLIYYKGKFIPRDIKKSIYYFTLAANQNNIISQTNLGLIYYEGKFIPRDINKAVYYFTLASNQNDAKSQYYLGFIYYFEHDFKDINKAIHYLNLASNQHFSHAQYVLGAIYEHGYDVSMDIHKSYQYYLRAANNNHSYGLLKIGLFYLKGNYHSLNIKNAIYYLTLSANNNCSEANFYLGCIYFEGIGLDRDIDQAIKYFKEGSSFNNNFCKNNLGIIYKNIKKNEVAIEYFEEAILQKNDFVAMYNLGHIYLYDEFNKGNIDKSIEILIKSANQKFYPSECLLSLAIFKKLSSSINIVNISNELEKHGNKSIELNYIVLDIINDLCMETNYQSVFSKFEKIEYIYNYNPAIADYRKYFENKLDESVEDAITKNQRFYLTQNFYDGFGLQFF